MWPKNERIQNQQLMENYKTSEKQQQHDHQPKINTTNDQNQLRKKLIRNAPYAHRILNFIFDG